ncbi:bifunctional metallophosphatase/5'-nucleotidase [Sphingomonas alba]|uniref:Bifunctional metallophosphatase/5'-nucleotidase n=1 Tax=Sphingomonas alba TaxID=2908208 RepID=A0ABT0RI46_9SPHN|nr:bifunctional metallophosphatase/5'-nucleotidase [Sphingomonas alba]MCL6682302.1 bifunctional metallophosphatase/5'-nucleotidase [Sphingomonas alba]
MRWKIALAPMLALAACTTTPRPIASVAQGPVEVQILAFNDFHGNIETPPAVEVTNLDGTKQKIVTGGAANLAGALAQARTGQPHTVTVSAGDTIGASPLISANYLDEPTIAAMNLLGLEFNSVGNHEFDKGGDELKRMQNGGCAKFTRRQPCAVDPFAGAKFRYLAANVIGPDGQTLFPATGIKRFGSGTGAVTIGFIGMTLRGTANIVTPSGVKGLTFADEAATANALVPGLKAQGADAIVLLVHQGGKTKAFTTGNDCNGLDGAILPILAKLDPAITTVVSGHTHWAYVCQNGEGGTAGGRLLTSAGKNGYFFTDIRLDFDPATHRLISQRASNLTVGTGERGQAPAVEALVARYATAVAPVANRIIGHLTATATRDENDWESAASDLIADSMLAATKALDMGGAQLALVNVTGVRVAIPAGDVRYADAFSMMPFGNNLLVMTLTGAQLKHVIEQQFAGSNRANGRPAALGPSSGFNYTVDLSRPSGERVVAMTLNGKSVVPTGRYRVVVNNYLASGGDGLSGFTEGTDITDKGMVDLDALVDWIAKGQTPPKPDRVGVRS